MNNPKSHVKLSRRLNIPLTSKASRIMLRKPYPPGVHGPGKRSGEKMSDYKRHLLEKQRLRAQYNISESQMRATVVKAGQGAGNTADNIIQLLETRLDALVHRAGLARTIYAARQFVSHGHILVNGRVVDIPSSKVKVNEVVSVKPKSAQSQCFLEAAEEMVGTPPAYLQVSKETMSAKLLFLPTREEVPVSCDITYVIEYYSK